jgi:ferrochelatase
VDCLETLEEIGMEGREIFLEAGGEDFQRIPCLNDNDDWIEAMAGMITQTPQ